MITTSSSLSVYHNVRIKVNTEAVDAPYFGVVTKITEYENGLAYTKIHGGFPTKKDFREHKEHLISVTMYGENVSRLQLTCDSIIVAPDGGRWIVSCLLYGYKGHGAEARLEYIGEEEVKV